MKRKYIIKATPLPRLLSLVQRFEEADSLCDQQRNSASRLSEAFTSAADWQMDTLSDQFTIEVSSAREVQRTTGIAKMSVFRILRLC